MFICSQLACVGILFSNIMVKSYNDVMKAEAEKSDIVCTLSFA